LVSKALAFAIASSGTGSGGGVAGLIVYFSSFVDYDSDV